MFALGYDIDRGITLRDEVVASVDVRQKSGFISRFFCCSLNCGKSYRHRLGLIMHCYQNRAP